MEMASVFVNLHLLVERLFAEFNRHEQLGLTSFWTVLGVPFDLRHVRVIYYDMRDPFWGAKLIEKVAENILSALQKPSEAILFPEKK